MKSGAAGGDDEALPPLSPSLALSHATVEVKITIELCLLCHWLTLSRIMDNHHRKRRAAHWSAGIPQWGMGWRSGFLGATTNEMTC